MSKHNEKKISQLSKQLSKQSHSGDSEHDRFVDQYRVIREDILKLRNDLTRGYDMAKEAIDKKTIISELMKLRSSF